jgi:hypothetical protein
MELENGANGLTFTGNAAMSTATSSIALINLTPTGTSTNNLFQYNLGFSSTTESGTQFIFGGINDTSTLIDSNITEGSFGGFDNTTMQGDSVTFSNTISIINNNESPEQGSSILRRGKQYITGNMVVLNTIVTSTSPAIGFFDYDGGATETAIYSHNTVVMPLTLGSSYNCVGATGGGSGIDTGEPEYPIVNDILKSNLLYGGSYFCGIISGDLSDTYVTDYNGVGVHHNDVFGPASATQQYYIADGGSGTNFGFGHPSSTYGDITADPMFVDPTRTSIANYDSRVLSGPGTVSDLFNQLGYRSGWGGAYTLGSNPINAIRQWLMAGYAPTNIALATAAADGTTIGAVAYTSVATTSTPPQSLSATSGNAQVSLSWSAPSSTGGSSITQYLVYDRFTGSSTFVQVASTSVSQTTSTVTSLTNGQSYDFEILAQNGVGTSTASNVVSSTPATIPSAPVSVSAVAGDTMAVISFTPSSTGGSPILYYTAVSNPGNITASSSGSPITVTNLTNGQSYTFTVTATNGIGTSASSSASNAVVPNTALSIITPTTVPTGTLSLAYSQILTAQGGGIPYTWSLISGSLPAGLSLGTSTTNGTTTISGTPSATTTTSFTVQVSSNGSTTSQAYTMNVITIPNAPTAVSATPGNGQASVSFTAPSYNGGSPILYYTAVSNPGNITASSSGSPITVTNLTNGQSYTFTVTATNAAGTSASSTPSSAIIPVAAGTVFFTLPSGGGGSSSGSSSGNTSSSVPAATSSTVASGTSPMAPTPSLSTTSTSSSVTDSSSFPSGLVPAILPTSTQGLQALIQTLSSYLQTLLSQAGGTNTEPSAPAASSFARNLELWSQGPDVTALQQFLIQKNTGPASQALKTHGISQIFGLLTYNALLEYQRSVGLPATGYFGPVTRAEMGK